MMDPQIMPSGNRSSQQKLLQSSGVGDDHFLNQSRIQTISKSQSMLSTSCASASGTVSRVNFKFSGGRPAAHQAQEMSNLSGRHVGYRQTALTTQGGESLNNSNQREAMLTARMKMSAKR